MTHVEQAYGDAPNEYRVAGPFIDLNFGLVEISWDAGVVTLKACDVNGNKAFEHDLPISSLQH